MGPVLALNNKVLWPKLGEEDVLSLSKFIRER